MQLTNFIRKIMHEPAPKNKVEVYRYWCNAYQLSMAHAQPAQRIARATSALLFHEHLECFGSSVRIIDDDLKETIFEFSRTE